MMTKFSQHISLFLILGLFISCNSKESAQKKPSEVQPEPTTPEGYVEQSTFTDLDGNEVSISDFKGKVILIDFWETWCRPCLATFPTLQKLQEEYPENFVVLAVTPGFTDTRQDAQTFASNHEYTFKFLMDSNELHKKLEVYGIPFKVYLDADGNFIKKMMGTAGPDGDYKMVKEIIEKHKKS